MRVRMRSLARLTTRDRIILGPAMRAGAQRFGAAGRPALAALFAALADALEATSPDDGIQLDALADLDDAELDQLVEGARANGAREEQAGRPARVAFFHDLQAALHAEGQRRREALAAMDRWLGETG